MVALQQSGIFNPRLMAQPSLTPNPTMTTTSFTTPWFGRDQSLEQVLTELSNRRRVTIVGPRAVGKTRLALEAARRIAPKAIERLEITDPTSALPLRPHTQTRCLIVETLETHPALEDHLQALSRDFPDLHVVCTTQRWPNHAVQSPTMLGALSPEAACELFLERSQRSQPGWTAAQERIETLCRRLDFLPGLIETAATLVNGLSFEALQAHLERGDSLQNVLTAVQQRRFPWGFESVRDLESHLSATEWKALQALSLFEDGFSLDSASVVTGMNAEGLELLEALTTLVDWNVLVVDQGSGRLGYRLLNNVRAHTRFGWMRESDFAEREARWMDHCVQTVRRATHPQLGYVVGDEPLEIHTADLERCVRRSLNEQYLDVAMSLITGLRAVFARRGQSEAVRDWSKKLLRDGRWNESGRVTIFQTLCFTSAWRGEYDELGRLAMEGVAMARRIDDTQAELRFLEYLAQYQHARKQPAGGDAQWQHRAERLALDSGDEHAQMMHALQLGQRELATNQLQSAQTHLEVALRFAQRHPDRVPLVHVYLAQGDIATRLGDTHSAVTRVLEALELARVLNATTLLRDALERLEHLAVALGQAELATRCHTVSLEEITDDFLVTYRTQVLEIGKPRPLRLEGRDLLLAHRLVQGDTNKQIARHLGVNEHAVRNRLSALYARYGCHNRAELVRLLLERHVVA
jgi:DNA-binding CsgD family transcriptional regulator/DNA-binding MarR family transcriptional regulator